MPTRLAFLIALAGAVACAKVAPPPGGPADETPPTLAEASPGSLQTRVDPTAPLRWVFSEKIDRRAFRSALTVVPPVALDGPRVDGTTVEMRPRTAWPPDTLVVWTLGPDLRDKHGVRTGSTRSGAFTTSDSVPAGVIRGTARLAVPPEKPVDFEQLVVRLSLPPAEGERRPRPWRSAQGRADGSFELPWLDHPSGPFVLELFLDRNASGKRDPREPVARVDSLSVPGADPIFVLADSLLVLVDLEGPVDCWFCRTDSVESSGTLRVWTRGEEDDRPRAVAVDSTGCSKIPLVPGRVRWGAWTDLDGDGRWSADSLGVVEPWVRGAVFEVLPARADTLVVPTPDRTATTATPDSLRVEGAPPAELSAFSPGPSGQ